MIVLWCNGSTTVFGSVCLGSNPGKTTYRKVNRIAVNFFVLYTSQQTPLQTHLLPTQNPHTTQQKKSRLIATILFYRTPIAFLV